MVPTTRYFWNPAGNFNLILFLFSIMTKNEQNQPRRGIPKKSANDDENTSRGISAVPENGFLAKHSPVQDATHTDDEKAEVLRSIGPTLDIPKMLSPGQEEHTREDTG